MVDLVVSVAEEVAETHNRVVPVLDKVLLGTVANVHLVLDVRDGAGNLALAVLVGNARRMALLVNDRDGRVRLAKVDTENDWLRPGVSAFVCRAGAISKAFAEMASFNAHFYSQDGCSDGERRGILCRGTTYTLLVCWTCCAWLCGQRHELLSG